MYVYRFHRVCVPCMCTGFIVYVYRFPVIAIGVLAWVDEILCDKSYFKLNTDHTPLHLVLVDEIVTNHLLLHQKALDLLIRLFESSFDELDVLVRVSFILCLAP